MNKILIASVSASVLVLTLGAAAVQAHGSQSGYGMMNGAQGTMGQGTTNGHGFGPNMMDGGMMGGMMGPEMMLIMMDTDGDGTLSSEEFQSLHTRMFNYLDTNGDGKIDADELNAFHGDQVGDATK